MIKDSTYVNIYGVNPLYLIFNRVNGYFQKSIANKYLTLAPTNESKEKKIRDLIRLITNNSDDYDEKYLKIKLNLDYELPLKNDRNSYHSNLLELFFMNIIDIVHKFC